MQHSTLTPRQIEIIDRARKIAWATGSGATTTLGLSRALARTDCADRARIIDRLRNFEPRATRTFTQEERAARRARDDKIFRAQWLKKQAREIARLQKPGTTLSEITAQEDSHRDRKLRLDALRALRALAGVRGKIPALPAAPGILIQPAGVPRSMLPKLDMRGKDAQILPTRKSSYLVAEPPVVEWNKRGLPRTVSRATRDNYVRSFAVIRDPRTLDYALHVREFHVSLPDGYAWSVDQHGLRAIRQNSPADDYHPEAGDLIAGGAAIVQKLEAHRELRLAERARLIAEAADADGVWVCLADSVRAGNCRRGSSAFAEKHGLDIARHYPALEILDRGNGDTGRVRLAISAAIHRHRAEMSRGYADLAEHTIQD